MPLVLNGATSGSTTIQATDAVTATLTLPSTTGTIVSKDANGIISVNGVKFPATQSASSDANTLDDYEEGTWTPVVADASSGGNTGTYTNNGSSYTKIGNTVTIWAYLSIINTTGMTSGNAFWIRNLPFQPNVFANGNFYTYRVARNASTVSSCLTTSISVPAINFNIFTTNSATVDSYITVGNIVSGTSEFFITVTYGV